MSTEKLPQFDEINEPIKLEVDADKKLHEQKRAEALAAIRKLNATTTTIETTPHKETGWYTPQTPVNKAHVSTEELEDYETDPIRLMADCLTEIADIADIYAQKILNASLAKSKSHGKKGKK